MIFLLLLAGVVTALALRSKRRELARLGRTDGVGYSVVKSALPCAVTFAGVAGFYSLLSLYVFWLGREAATLDRLYDFENLLAAVRLKASWLKPSAGASLLVLLGLFGLSAAAVFLRDRSTSKATRLRKASRRWSAAFARYSRVVRSAYAVLMLLSSFSFLAPQLGPSDRRLELRIKHIEEESARQGAGLLSAVRDQLEEELPELVLEEAPVDLADWLNDQTLIRRELERVSEARERAKEVGVDPLKTSKAELEVKLTDTALKKALERPGLERSTPRPYMRSSVPVSENPTRLSVEKLQRLEERLDHRRSEHLKKAKVLLSLPESQALGRQSVKFAVKRLGVSQSLGEIHPLLSPIGKILNDTLADLVSRLAQRALFQPLARRLSEPALGSSDAAFLTELRSATRDLIRSEGRIAEQWAAHSERLSSEATRTGEDLATLKAQRTKHEREIRTAESRLETRRVELVGQLRESFERLAGRLKPKSAALSPERPLSGIYTPVRQQTLRSRSADDFLREYWGSTSPTEQGEAVGRVLEEIAEGSKPAVPERKVPDRSTGRVRRPSERPPADAVVVVTPKSSTRIWRDDAVRYLEILAKSYESGEVTSARVAELERLQKTASSPSRDAELQFEVIEQFGKARFGIDRVPRQSEAEVIARHRARQYGPRNKPLNPYGRRTPYKPPPRPRPRPRGRP